MEIANLIAVIERTADSQDDIIVFTPTKAEHDRPLEQVMRDIEKAGLKFNRAKCVFGAKKFFFLGHHVSGEGIIVDLSKVSAILDMPIPQNREDLQSFLGMVMYLGKLVKNLSEITAPLQALLGKDVEWSIQNPQLKAINTLKEIPTTSPVLQFYNALLPTRVSCDTSCHGLGAILGQQDAEKNWRPVTYAS